MFDKKIHFSSYKLKISFKGSEGTLGQFITLRVFAAIALFVLV